MPTRKIYIDPIITEHKHQTIKRVLDQLQELIELTYPGTERQRLISCFKKITLVLIQLEDEREPIQLGFNILDLVRAVHYHKDLEQRMERLKKTNTPLDTLMSRIIPPSRTRKKANIDFSGKLGQHSLEAERLLDDILGSI